MANQREKHERMLREAGETALTLIEDRGRANAHAWAKHCATRDTTGFWRQVTLAVEEMPANEPPVDRGAQ